MKVGLAIYGDLSGKSGGYLYDRSLVEHLQLHDNDVEVVSVPGWCRTSALLNNFDPRLLRRLLELDVDVLVEDELCHHSFALLNPRLRKSISYPLVGLFHFLACRAEPDRARAHRLEVVERRFATTLDGGIFNSASTAAAARSLAPDLPGVIARPGRDHVEPTAVPKQRTDRLRVLFLGSIAPGKGLDVLLRAMALLPRDRFVLDIAGPVVDMSYLRSVLLLIEKASLGGQVRFWGWVGKQDRQALLERADVLAVPSIYEGYGLVFVEALASGVPVIAPRPGGAGEIISDGVEGFLVEAGDHPSVAAHLSSLEQDRDLWGMMSARARERYGQLPEWKEEMERARSYLETLIDR